MKTTFFLFDVGHGQSAMLRTEEGWYVFDVGSSSEFSPIKWMAKDRYFGLVEVITSISEFKFNKVTISHFHGDHLTDWYGLKKYLGRKITAYPYDRQLLLDCMASNHEKTWPALVDILGFYKGLPEGINEEKVNLFTRIREIAMPLEMVKEISADATASVNNASIVSRIDISDHSILLCGDVMKEGWDVVINHSQYGIFWKEIISNVDVLVAPHHGHSSAFSESLFKYAKPKVVLISAAKNDSNIDPRYLKLATGLSGNGKIFKVLQTHAQGHIKMIFKEKSFWEEKGISFSFGSETLGD